MAGKQIATDGNCHLDETAEEDLTDLVKKFSALLDKKDEAAGLKEKIAARMEEMLKEAEARNNEYDASKLEKLRLVHEDVIYLVNRLLDMAEYKNKAAERKDKASAKMVEVVKEVEEGKIEYDASKFELLCMVHKCMAKMEQTYMEGIKSEGCRLQKLAEGLGAGKTQDGYIAWRMEHVLGI